ncbi:MAG: hypothetical protein SCALA702_22160 [Melioribacteraceae bacterium]|nr:MAG: hypothetical protein SCALA702_22160 [Melioribacteraceae bacterium]
MYRKFLLLLLLLISGVISAQISQQTQVYRSDEYGDIQFRREGTMDGNQVRTLFYNNGEVGQWPFQPSGEWPKGTGHSYLDGVAVLIASEITAPGNGQVVHPLETSYREWMDKDRVTGLIWGLEPVPGYMNVNLTTPAINTNPNSWPETWPNALPEIETADTTWDGLWYGYFGKGIANSDFETFFVMDDSKDKEFTRAPYSYYPVAADSNRGGLGLRVEVRGFQWSHVLAEDIIFWHYDIVNLSDSVYDKSIFGFYTDTGVGGTDDSDDDNASYDTQLDLAYAYDNNGVGVPGSWPTGYYGYAYLESPGNATNGIDDDEDGMVDERRDDGVDNDGDWTAYSDLNGNGKWDPEDNEPLNNDVGQDGIGPLDRQYTGPDLGEGDGLPTAGEPNFDKTDIDESDMIGLTSLSIYRLGDGGTGGGWPKDDESMWERLNYLNFDTTLQRANISMAFSSGPFPLELNRRERFSMALVFGSNFEDLVFNKETVQEIYNANYNFSKPPLKPVVTAVPGDKKVFLYWDDIAEESRDPFLGYDIPDDPSSGYKKDFEGYMIYRSTEPEFNDIKLITDSKGEPKYWKPIAQFDLIDDIEGPDPIGINGAHFWRGNNSGLQHSYVDEDVVNGQKYYYAVVSYDMGDPEFGTKGLIPSECTKIITEDFAGNIQFVDINCAVITPNAPAAGYQPPQVDGDVSSVSSGIGTGYLEVSVLNSGAILEGAQYEVGFKADGGIPEYETANAFVVRNYSGQSDTIVTAYTADEFGAKKFTQPFDGLAISVINDTATGVVDSLTGWLIGTSNLTMNVYKNDLFNPARTVAWPGNYEIKFFDDVVDTSFGTQGLPVNFTITNTLTGKQCDFYIDDEFGNGFTIDDDIIIMEYIDDTDPSTYRFTWKIEYDAPGIPNVQPMEPVAGDIFRIVARKQFFEGDKFSFSTQAAGVDNVEAETDLEKISVVPNPYVASASWEARNLNQTGRGERRIDFVNLPAECTIRVYTISGALVKTIYKEYSPTDGTASWNLVTEDGMEVAYGIYIYHVDAPEVGEHIGKFALIK